MADKTRAKAHFAPPDPREGGVEDGRRDRPPAAASRQRDAATGPLQIQLEVLTPDESVLNARVQAIRVQLPDGWWGILPRHAPFLAQIVAGIMLYRQEQVTRYVALYQGTIEVQRYTAEADRVLVLTAAAEAGENLEELEQALERQLESKEGAAREAHIEFTRARMALARALRETTGLEPLGPVRV